MPDTFKCPDNIRPHLESVFSGEYDIPFEFDSPRVIDLGANCGAFSVWASHRWPGATISAYEPHPENFRFLEENTRDMSRVFRHNRAVGTPGWRILGDGLFNGGEASLVPILNNPYPTGRHVEVMSPLELPVADIIKLDIEGCEVEVLGPLLESGRCFSAVLLEWHSEGLRRQVDALLSDYSLVKSAVYNITGRGLACYVNNNLMRGL